MTIKNSLMLFVILYIIETILQIYILYRFKKNYNKKIWFNFLSISFTTLICSICACAYFITNLIKTNFTILHTIIFGVILGINFILLIIGLIIHREAKKRGGERGDYRISIVLRNIGVIVVCNLLILLLIPTIGTQTITKGNENFVVNYLNQKYGNGNYEIIEVYQGNYYSVKSDFTNNTFIVATNSSSSRIKEDYFLPIYYSENYNLNFTLVYNKDKENLDWNFDDFDKYILNAIKNKYSIDETQLNIQDLYRNYIGTVGYNSNFNMIPQEFGDIPILTQLVELTIQYYNEHSDTPASFANQIIINSK